MAATPSAEGLERLKKLVPISTLPEKDQEQLLQQVAIESLKKGDILFRQGDSEPKNIYLLAGQIELLVDNKVVDVVADNKETSRYPLAHQFPRKLSARAKTHVEYVSIDSRMLNDLVENAHSSAYTVDDVGASEDDWMSQLLSSPIFQLIPPANIQNIMMRMERMDINKDEKVIEQGEDANYFYLVNRGHCVVSRSIRDGEEPVEIAHLGPGDSFGEEALLSDSSRGSTVTMTTDGVLFRLSKADFTTFVRHSLAQNVSYEEACKAIDANGKWLDVRPKEDYEQNHLNGSISLPLEELRFQASSLEPDHRYIVYCADGKDSSVAAFLLLGQGIDAAVLEGGLNAIPSESPTAEDTQPQEGLSSAEPQIQAEGGKTPEAITKLTQERDEARSQIQALKGHLLKMRTTHEQTQSKLSANIEALTKSLKRSEESVVKLKQQIAELEGEQPAPDEQIRKLKDDRRQLEGELEILMAASQENEEEQLAELNELKGQLSELRQQLATVEKEKEALQKELEALRT